jgi:lysophospholipase L1-like esterase
VKDRYRDVIAQCLSSSAKCHFEAPTLKDSIPWTSKHAMGKPARILRRFGHFAVVGSLFACQAEFDKPLTEERFQGNGGIASTSGGSTSTAGSAGSSAVAGGSGGTAGTGTSGSGGSVQGGSSGSAQGGTTSATGGSSGSSGSAGTAGTGGSSGGSGGTSSTGENQGEPGTIGMSDGTLHILPLGDSITLGAQGGYRNDLYNALTEQGYKVDMVGTQYDTSTEIDDKDHEGHPGFTIANMRSEVDGYLSAITTPDVVIVMLGTNDEAWWTTKKPEETKDEMVELVDHLREKLPDAVLIISTIPPQSSMNVEPVNMDRAEMTKQYNAGIKTALGEHKDAGKKVFVADPNAILTLSDLYDGIHPSREAHTRIAGVFEDVMIGLLPEPPR